MKVTKDQFNALCAILNDKVSTVMLQTSIVKYKDKGLSLERFLWDVLWACSPYTKEWFKDVYQNCNDDNITTALKAWFKSTGLSY